MDLALDNHMPQNYNQTSVLNYFNGVQCFFSFSKRRKNKIEEIFSFIQYFFQIIAQVFRMDRFLKRLKKASFPNEVVFEF